jgi:uncharacterized peroxidase-related enzyme
MEQAERERWLAAIARDWREARLEPVDRALCEYAEKLTRSSAHASEADVAALRAHGLDDVAIHDAVQVIAYFNYINRVASGVDVELEPEMPPPSRPFGATGAP